MWNQVTDVSSPPKDVYYVLEGGALLHRIPWHGGETYDVYCGRYVKYATDKYGSATVVFDGYESGPSTKDMTHSERVRSGIGAEVHLKWGHDLYYEERLFPFQQVQHGKVHHIRHGIGVLPAGADADVLVVQTAVASAERHNTVLVGDDTDFLVLLCSRQVDTKYDIYVRPEPK